MKSRFLQPIANLPASPLPGIFASFILLTATPLAGAQNPAQTPAQAPAAAQSAQPDATVPKTAEQAPEPTKVESPKGPVDPVQQRKDQIAADSAKLFQLANELKAEMDKSTKDTLSLSVMKKAEEVEKLARKVRDEMRASLSN
jgi:hypothetical protein